MVIPESQIRALIRLLGDEDEKIVQTISGRLIDIGPSAVPLLQEAEIEQPEMAERIASVLEEIRGGKLEDELMAQAALPDDGMDLEQCAFLIARYAYPSLDVSMYSHQLDEMAQEVRDRICAVPRAVERDRIDRNLLSIGDYRDYALNEFWGHKIWETVSNAKPRSANTGSSRLTASTVPRTSGARRISRPSCRQRIAPGEAAARRRSTS